MNSNVFYKTLIPDRGSKITFNPDSWTEVREWARKAREIIGSGTTPFYNEDLAFLEFTIDQYLFMADSRSLLIEAATAYNRASSIQRTDLNGAAGEVEKSLKLIGDLEKRFRALRADFEILWDMESRAHWRDRALLTYAKHEDAFANTRYLIEQALERLKQGLFLPPPTEVRMDIRSQSGQYFQFWLLVGSFTIDSFAERHPDFLEPMGGEAAAKPFPGQKFTDKSGQERMWIKYDSPKMGEIDFKTIFEPHITAVAYAYCTIDSPEKQQVTALLGSNDGATVWCNGEEVHHVHTKRDLIPDEDRILLDLEEGRNHILIKVEQWKAGWGLSFRLEGVDVRNHKQKYYIQ
jgi:hypothetical protein